MECPHCKHDIQLDNTIIQNVTTYQKNSIAACPNCQKGLVTIPVLGVRVVAYYGEQQEDDWGQPLCK